MALDLQPLHLAKQRALAVPGLPTRLALQTVEFFSQLAQHGNPNVVVAPFRLTITHQDETLSDVPTRILGLFFWAETVDTDINIALNSSQFGNSPALLYLEAQEFELSQAAVTFPAGVINEAGNLDLNIHTDAPGNPVRGFVVFTSA